MTDHGAQLLKHLLVFLEGRGDFVGGHPRIGIKTFGAQFQPFAFLFVQWPLGDTRDHFGVARAQAGDTLRAQSLQRRGNRNGVARFSGFSGFSGFSRFYWF
jgi:hypothetical protein